MSAITFTTDHVPYPAGAGNTTLVNDGTTARTFLDGRSISGDVSKAYAFTYRGGDTVVDNPQDVTSPQSYIAGSNITGITIGNSGAFTCTATSLKVGDRVAISGRLGFTASIVNYAGGPSSGLVYLVSAVTGTSPNVTGFTLKTTEDVAITTQAPATKTLSGANTTAAVDELTDRLTITGHGFGDLTEVTYTVQTSQAVLGPLVSGTKYFVKVFGPNTIALYNTLANATTAGSTGRQNFTTSTISSASATVGHHKFTSTLSELTFTSQIFSSEPLATLLSHAIGITSNGVLIMPPSTRDVPLMGSAPNATAPFGFNWDVVKRSLNFNLDGAGGKPIDNSDTSTDIYCYRSGNFLGSAWDNAIFKGSSDYYTSGLTHSDGHSKIIGIAFDGYPIYGSKGYITATNKDSAVTDMVSSYKTKSQPASGRTFTYVQQEAGSFVQDYEYSVGHNGSTLDEHNGRFCVTPDFPNGTYAYFVTATYPYIIGPSTKAQRSVTIT